MEKNQSLNTGDINLASALMSVGIPLDQHDPCSLVLRDDGKNYARFHLMMQSVDGSYQTERLMSFWKSPNECSDVSFSAIMDFVKSGRACNVRTSREWFDYAHAYLEEMQAQRPDAPSTIGDVPAFISANQNGAASHIFAFAYNREDCWQVMNKARRRILITRGESHASIDANLEKWKRNELLARLEG
jgi:hypothetical protein